MKILAVIATSILINMVGAIIVTWVFMATLLNPHYLVQEADRANIYPGAQHLLLDSFVENIPEVQERQQTRDALDKVVTPDYLKKKVASLSEALYTRMHGGSVVPSLDVSDFGDQLKAAGYKIDTSNLPKSIPLPNTIDAPLTHGAAVAYLVQFWLAVGCGILFLVVLLISIKVRQYRSLIYFFLTTGLSVLSLALLFMYGPQVILEQLVRLDGAARATLPLFEPMIVAIGRDIGMRFLYIGLGFMLATIAFFAISRVSKAKTITTKNKTPAT